MKMSILSLALGVVLASPVAAHASENPYGRVHRHRTTHQATTHQATIVQTPQNRRAELQPRRLRQLRLRWRRRWRRLVDGRRRLRMAGATVGHSRPDRPGDSKFRRRPRPFGAALLGRFLPQTQGPGPVSWGLLYCGTAKMRRSEFGWHDDHLMKNLAVALALAVIGASVVDSLLGAVVPYKDSLKLTCAEAKADMPEIDGATLGRPTMLNPISMAKSDGGGCQLRTTPSRTRFADF